MSAIDSLEKSPLYVFVVLATQLLTFVKGFEEILSSTNVLNRKLEEVLGMTKEYDTIASLWYTFYELMRSSGVEVGNESVLDGPNSGGLPGTGGHVVTTSKEK